MNRLICTALALVLLGADAPLAAQSMPGSTSASQAGFGRALALIGTDLLVGEPFNETTPGMVHIYRKVAGNWAESGSLHASDANNSDGFGFALATSGNLLLVSAHRADANRGAAYIFARDAAGKWAQVARLSAADGAPSENYGTSVALGGDIALVAAPGQNKQTGAVYVYRRSGSAWAQEAKLTSPEAKEQAFFGQGVAVVGDRILVGEPGYQERTGAVHVYTREGAQWQTSSKLSPAGMQKGDRFGAPLHVDGERVFASAVGFGGAAGAVYTFQRESTGDLREAGRVYAFDARPADNFGAAVAAEGNNIWVSSPRANGARGAVYHVWRNAPDTLTGGAERIVMANANGGDFLAPRWRRPAASSRSLLRTTTLVSDR